MPSPTLMHGLTDDGRVLRILVYWPLNLLTYLKVCCKKEYLGEYWELIYKSKSFTN